MSKKRADGEVYAKMTRFSAVWDRVFAALGPDRYTEGVRLSLETCDGSGKYCLVKTRAQPDA